MEMIKRLIFLAAIVTAFFSCSPMQLGGGSGTETVGGLAVDADSKPVSGVFVSVRKSDFLDTGSVSSTENPDIFIADTVTDAEGKFSVNVEAIGLYTIEIYDDKDNAKNAAFVQCTVNVSDSSYYVQATLRKIGELTGKIKQSKETALTRFYISPYGIARHTVLTDDYGNFTIPDLPEGEHRFNITSQVPIFQSFDTVGIEIIAGESKEVASIEMQKAQFTIHPGDSSIVRAILDSNGLQSISMNNSIVTTDTSWPYRVIELSINDLRHDQNRFQTLTSRIGELSELRKLTVSKTFIAIVPKEIGNLIHLKELSFKENYINSIAPQIGKLDSLEVLNLSLNKGLKFLPQEIGNLSFLQSLNVNTTILEELPSTVGNLHALKTIDISYCQLKTLPAELANCVNLQHVNAEYNVIDSIPLSITSLGASFIHQFIDFNDNSICRDVQDQIPEAVFDWLDQYSTDPLWRNHSKCGDLYCIPDADK
jgi:hypothetical protein